MGELSIRHNGVEIGSIPAEVEAPSGVVAVTGDHPEGFTVPEGQTWEILGLVTTPKNVIVNGTLRMRPGSTLRFRNVNEAAFVGSGAGHSAPIATDVGLWITEHGVLDAQGSSKTAWTHATGALAINATVVNVDSTGGWKVGDTLVFTPTAPITASNFWDRYSTRQIAEVISPTQVRLNLGLQNAHPATFATCEVLNLTRDVKIEGTQGGNSHVMWGHSHNPVHISNVEFSWLGVRNKRGRYPVHMHLMGEASQGSLIEDCVVRNSWNHAYVPHTSNGVTFDGCIAHDIFEDAYWWDQDGSRTSALTWRDCVASKVDGGYRVGGFNHSIDDGGPNATERKNTCVGCVAVGVAGDGDSTGFDSGANSSDPGGFLWPERETEDGGEWVWHDNVAHNCRFNGIFTWQNDSLTHVVDRAHLYNCGAGINHGAYFNRYVYQHITIEGCRHGIWLHASTGSGDGMRFYNIYAAVTGPRAILLNSVTGGFPGTPGVRFQTCYLIGYTTAAIHARGDGGGPADDEFPGRWEFHDTVWGSPTLPKVQMAAGAPTGTTIREYVGGTLVQTYSK